MGAVYHVEKLLRWYFWYSVLTVIFEVVHVGAAFTAGGACAPRPSIAMRGLTGAPVFICGVADGASVLFAVLMLLASFYFLYVIWVVKELVRRTLKFPGLARFYEPWSVASECSSLTQDPPQVRGSHGPYSRASLPAASMTYRGVPAALPPSSMVQQVSPPRPQPAAAMPSWAPMIAIPVPTQMQAPDPRLSAGMPSWTINSWNNVQQSTVMSAFPQNTMVSATQVPSMAVPQTQVHSPKSEPAPRSRLPLQTMGAIPNRPRSTSPAVARSLPALRPSTTESIRPATTGSLGPSTPPPAVTRSLSPVARSQPSLSPIVVPRPRSLSPVKLN